MAGDGWAYDMACTATGKIATTSSLQEELATNYASADRDARFKRAQEMGAQRYHPHACSRRRRHGEASVSYTTSFSDEGGPRCGHAERAACGGMRTRSGRRVLTEVRWGWTAVSG